MKCIVCDEELGLWAKLTGHSSTGGCKKCEQQGRNQARLLLQAVGASSFFKVEYAERWLQQFEEIKKNTTYLSRKPHP